VVKVEFVIGEKPTEVVIEVGDVFLSNEDKLYVYKQELGTHMLQNVFTMGQFDRCDDEHLFLVNMKQYIKDRKLTHYPKKHYKMQINFIPK